MRIARRTSIQGLQPEIVAALAILEPKWIAATGGEEPVIAAARNGCVDAPSQAHRAGRAVDIATQFLGPHQIADAAHAIREALAIEDDASAGFSIRVGTYYLHLEWIPAEIEDIP